MPHARCKRSHSYYSNSLNANNTDVDVAADVTSLLDYTHKESICFYCVCSVIGDTAGCINRNPWFCQWYRDARRPNAARHRYRVMFYNDRPGYFRDISWRLRRTMDDGMFDLIDNGRLPQGRVLAPVLFLYVWSMNAFFGFVKIYLYG